MLLAAKWITISPPLVSPPSSVKSAPSELHAKSVLWMLRHEWVKKEESDCSNTKSSPLSAHPSMGNLCYSSNTFLRVHNTLTSDDSHQTFSSFFFSITLEIDFIIMQAKRVVSAPASSPWTPQVASFLNGNFLVSSHECILAFRVPSNDSQAERDLRLADEWEEANDDGLLELV